MLKGTGLLDQEPALPGFAQAGIIQRPGCLEPCVQRAFLDRTHAQGKLTDKGGRPSACGGRPDLAVGRRGFRASAAKSRWWRAGCGCLHRPPGHLAGGARVSERQGGVGWPWTGAGSFLSWAKLSRVNENRCSWSSVYPTGGDLSSRVSLG